MGTNVKHPVLELIKPSFVIFDIWTLTLSPYGNSGCQRVDVDRIDVITGTSARNRAD